MLGLKKVFTMFKVANPSRVLIKIGVFGYRSSNDTKTLKGPGRVDLFELFFARVNFSLTP